MIIIQFLVSHVMVSFASHSKELQSFFFLTKMGEISFQRFQSKGKNHFFFPIKIQCFFLGLIHLASNRQESHHRNSLSGLQSEVEGWFPPKWESSLLPTKFSSPKIPKGNYIVFIPRSFNWVRSWYKAFGFTFFKQRNVFSKALVLSDYPPLPRSNIICIRLLTRNQERILFFKVTKVVLFAQILMARHVRIK